MATTADYLTQLQADKQTLVNNLIAKGVNATNEETFTSLVPKVTEIQSGGGGSFEITNAYYLFYKGYRIDVVNELCALISDKCTDFSYMFRDASTLKEVPKINTSGGTTFTSMFDGCRGLTKITKLDISKATNIQYLFQNCSALTEIPEFDFSNIESLYGVFAGCKALTSIKFKTSEKLTNIRGIFQGCSLLTEIPFINTSNVTNFRDSFRECSELTSIPFIDTSNGTIFNSMFADSRKLASIPNLNTSKAQDVSYMFNRCYALLEIPELDFGSVTNVSSILNEMPNITTLGGFKDLGKGYLTSSSANYSNYKLDLSRSPSLTHDSLMNVINKLYDIASAGVKSQQLVLGSTNLAKLEATEEGQQAIASAQVKGWTVS